MVVVGGTYGDPQGLGLHLAADRCPALMFQLQGQRGRGAGSAGGSVRQWRWTSARPDDPAIISLGGENDQQEEPHSFYGYLRSMVLPSNYLPLGARLGIELW